MLALLSGLTELRKSLFLKTSDAVLSDPFFYIVPSVCKSHNKVSLKI